MTTQNNYQRILNYIELIQKKAKKDVKFFYFEDGKKFIVDGNRIKLLPFEFHKLYSKDEFYVHINPSDKKVMYYAFDIQDYVSGKNVNEEEGYMKWEDVEDCIYNFFVLNIKELAETIAPYTEVQDPKPSQTTYQHNHGYTPGYNGGGYGNHTPTNYTSGYGTGSYKEREAFYDKLWAFLKENKTTSALDFIGTHFKKMSEDKKFEDIDTMLRLISFDKLNTPTMLGILDATGVSDDHLKSRKEFFDKVKAHLTKIKPARAGFLLRNLEPGKMKNAPKQDTGTSKSV